MQDKNHRLPENNSLANTIINTRLFFMPLVHVPWAFVALVIVAIVSNYFTTA